MLPAGHGTPPYSAVQEDQQSTLRAEQRTLGVGQEGTRADHVGISHMGESHMGESHIGESHMGDVVRKQRGSEQEQGTEAREGGGGRSGERGGEEAGEEEGGGGRGRGEKAEGGREKGEKEVERRLSLQVDGASLPPSEEARVTSLRGCEGARMPLRVEEATTAMPRSVLEEWRIESQDAHEPADMSRFAMPIRST
eukprot:2798121-Rhodomonas_salina.3